MAAKSLRIDAKFYLQILVRALGSVSSSSVLLGQRPICGQYRNCI